MSIKNLVKTTLAIILLMTANSSAQPTTAPTQPKDGETTRGFCGLNCATCNKAPEGGEFCSLCYKSLLISSTQTDGCCDGRVPQGCLYTSKTLQGKIECSLCEIGKVLVKSDKPGKLPICEDSPKDYDCAVGTKIIIDEEKNQEVVTCTACRNGVELVNGRCAGSNGVSIEHCEAVRASGCVKCKGNMIVITTESGCPNPENRCISKQNDLCISCNVEDGKYAAGMNGVGSQVCEDGLLMSAHLFLVGFLISFWGWETANF